MKIVSFSSLDRGVSSKLKVWFEYQAEVQLLAEFPISINNTLDINLTFEGDCKVKIIFLFCSFESKC